MTPPDEIPIFAGLDLAWSPRNNTAGAALAWDSKHRQAYLYASRDRLGDNAEIIAWLETVTGREGPALLGIDAPLVVPGTHLKHCCPILGPIGYVFCFAQVNGRGGSHVLMKKKIQSSYVN